MAQALLGMIGYKRSGKDAFAAAIQTDPYNFVKLGFADPLREAAYDANPIVGTFALTVDGKLRVDEWHYADVIDALGYEAAKDYVPEVRAFLQRFGTNAIRKIAPNFWVDQALGRIDENLKERSVVVTDVRFPNEAEAIADRGGTLVRVVRPGFEPAPDAHESETALDGYPEDILVVNDGPLERLEVAARQIASLSAWFSPANAVL